MTELDEGKRVLRDFMPKAIEYNDTYMLPFEASFLSNGAQAAVNTTLWYQDYWLSGSITVCVVYVSSVLWLQRLMAGRKPVQVDSVLLVWNVANALLAAMGAARCAGEFANALSYGFETSVCYSVSHKSVAGCWHAIFAVSKLIELGDTVFLVLRKRPLTLLHVYHHASVLAASWYAGSEHNGAARWYITMNYAVHAAMYGYFALKAYGAKISRLASMCLTMTQIAQFVTGLVTCYVVYVAKTAGRQCQHSWANWATILVMYLSYFALFMRFFIHAYLTKAKSKRQ